MSATTTQGKAFDRKLFGRVFAFTKPYRRIFWAAVVLTLVLSLVGVVRPLMMGWIVDVVAQDYNSLFQTTEESSWNAKSIAWTASFTRDHICLLYTSRCV